ncbi:DUF4375 domain-containing protein [Eubacterium sp.]|uniref:DMP19 family protein n=1 Tax=Eubacterium sp. TaxID=142586 RepID=UPI0025E32CD6|nr:DUF4375 domain-containing protein [Eubacterium sp.]MCR5628574.1 DMP19 family protein [Eubacterium sp.]
MKIKKIFKINEPDEFAAEISEYLNKKTDYGEELDGLNEVEKIVYLVGTLQEEVNSGGFDSFFSSSYGNHWKETKEACDTIGAVKTANMIMEVVKIYGCDLPKDTEDRIDVIEENAPDGYEDKIDAIDERFYEYEENIDEIIYDFCMEHKEAFR